MGSVRVEVLIPKSTLSDFISKSPVSLNWGHDDTLSSASEVTTVQLLSDWKQKDVFQQQLVLIHAVLLSDWLCCLFALKQTLIGRYLVCKQQIGHAPY